MHMTQLKKDVYSSSWNLRATERHLPYGITRCYLSPDRWARPTLTPPMQAGTRFTYPGGWKAELTLLLGNAAAGSRTRDLSVKVKSMVMRPRKLEIIRLSKSLSSAIYIVSCDLANDCWFLNYWTISKWGRTFHIWPREASTVSPALAGCSCCKGVKR